MKKLQLSIFLLLNVLLGFTQNNEQKQRLEVIIDGKNYYVNENDTLLVNNKPIIINLAKTQILNSEGISFEYPNHLSLRTEKESGLDIYSLDGDDIVISKFVFQVAINTEDLANDLIKDFGKKNCKIDNTKITLNSNTFEGSKITAGLLKSKLTIEIYKISEQNNLTQILIIQDSKNEDGSDSSEYKNAIEILNKTFVVK
ncbi:MAG: hypothetical protein A3G95_04840 [Flavobacteria bacterium RIFCSPLOWO2_12_FULL_31_7]|jgi:hypothetical protein|nr:MAG: hypothetical protein A3G95_04840 [Flavobacteria bacterium RIFCSPLOWO2_12_FULL_31_7]